MSLRSGLEAYLSRTGGGAVSVADLQRIPGGASRETYSFDAVDADGGRRGLILRRDPPESLIDTDRRVEHLALASFHPIGVPTPAPVASEPAGTELDRPFLLMTRIEGGAAASPFAERPYAPHEARLARQMFGFLGVIARPDPRRLPLAEACPAPEPAGCALAELDRWEGVLDRAELGPSPLARAAFRTLRRRPPPPAQKLSAVHGDYRSGNFLHDGAGRLLAVLDWEMAHIGDPLEDLAWAMDPLWRHGADDRMSGLASREEALAIWREASGLSPDPEGLAWWELFASLKGLIIWITAGRAFRAGGGSDPVLGFTALYCGRRHEEILAEALERRLEGSG